MSSGDVANLLKELDADTMKKDAGNRKARLKEVIGVGERSSVTQNEAFAVVTDGVKEEVEKKGEQEKKKKDGKLPGKATGPPPGKITRKANQAVDAPDG
ncbi:MAG: hypothetical protein Q9171_007501 [Xanthocarpia ochracea]